jgi:mono/diheme cytochrome c family protein
MPAFPFLSRGRQARFLWLPVIAAGFCFFVAKTTAQNTPASPSATNTPLPAQPPTYLRDVRPVLMGACARCHNEESRFVYDWLDYKTAYADRWEIRRRVWDSWKGSYYKESMPIDNSPESQSISDAQRVMIRDWVDKGAPCGTVPVTAAPATRVEKIDAGHRLFTSICAACHQPNGVGRPNMFPPLAGSDFLNADKARAINIAIFGRQGEVLVNGRKYNNNMPAFPLSDEDIADVLTYVYNSFGNSGLEVTAAEVKGQRSQGPASPLVPAAKSEFE